MHLETHAVVHTIKYFCNRNLKCGTNPGKSSLVGMGPPASRVYCMIPSLNILDYFRACFIVNQPLTQIQCALRFRSTLTSLTEMLGDLTTTTTKLNRYIELFPTNATLREYLKRLYNDYVGFCINTIIFYKKWPCCKSFIEPPLSPP